VTQPGDQVEVEATTSADGSSLVAVNVHDEPNWIGVPIAVQ